MPFASAAYADAESKLRACADTSSAGCWLWTGAVNVFGYGQVTYNGDRWYAHRLAFMVWVGPLATGRDVVHLCGQKHCIRPDHLDAISRQASVQRGITPLASRTTCKSGKHDVSDASNLRWSRDHWSCRLCTNEREAERRARKRAGQAQLLSAAALAPR